MTTEQVISRVTKSLFPFLSNERVFMGDSYDLYGPVWIMITLIVFSCVFGYFSHNLQDWVNGKETKYDVTKVAKAASLCCTYFLLNPLLLFLVAKFVLLIQEIRYLHLFTVYGYSFSSFILMSVLYVLPLEMTHVLSALIASFISLTFIFKELR